MYSLCVDVGLSGYCVFFFKQKTAYEMRISDWSSDVCSSDLHGGDRDGDDRRGDEGQAHQRSRIRPSRAPCRYSSVRSAALATRRATRSRPKSEERPVGKEWLRKCRFRVAPYH